MYKHPPQKKVPGDMTYDRKHEKQGYIQDISLLSKSQLLDLKNRQEMLLRNKKRISMLPDKGLKINNFYEQILKQLQIHENIDSAAELFSELNISAVGSKSITKMEWNGNNFCQHPSRIIDSDDEIDYPLKILTRNENKDITIDEKTKISRDLHQHESMEMNTKADVLEMDLNHSRLLSNLLSKNQQSVGRNDSAINQKVQTPAQLDRKEFNVTSKKFLPFRTTKSDVHNPEKEKERYKEHENKWENTSATPPSLKHSPAMVLSLEESVRLQEEKNNLLQQAQERYAEERLHQKNHIKEKVMLTTYSDLMQSSNEFQTYRSASESEEELLESDQDLEYSETQDT